MKHTSQNIPILVLLFTCFCFTQCKKNSTNPIDQLPPSTQTGANTFGCLINGQAFTPGGSSLSGPDLAGIYQYLISGTPNGYTFAIDGSNKSNPCNITGVGFGFDSVSISTGTYPLRFRKNGQGGGGYRLLQCNAADVLLYTNDSIGGQLTITRFDLSNQIASGTFWFDVLDNNGDTIKITDGRFDVHFTE
jgi:hypothetical protein